MSDVVSKAEEPPRVWRADYCAPTYSIRHTELEFDLDPELTVVRTRLLISPSHTDSGPLYLDGLNLDLRSLHVDGRAIGSADWNYDGRRLELAPLARSAWVETRVRVRPRENTSTMGLCVSRDGDLYTQCEAESFRRFSFGIDRPDVLSTYDVLLRADRTAFPTLLSNGEMMSTGASDGGRHYARWLDTRPKPTYLFALAAGAFVSETRAFRTRTGKSVAIGLHTRPQYREPCLPCLDFAEAAMRWDEETFQREYDSPAFNICVLNGFPAAMENQGLNIYDLSWASAGRRNTTDDDYEYRMKTVAHEYLHHWSGNRVTIRNWFQITLKEGLTRFRDQLFIGDRTEMASVRIRMARHMRAHQFAEDDGPLAHAPLAESYIEPRNLYTNTVYDKGQEIFFMLTMLVGRGACQQAISEYFDRYEGQAVTIDELILVLEEKTGRNLDQFRLWWTQAGVTDLFVATEYDDVARTLRLTLAQKTRRINGAPAGQPRHIPVAIGLIGDDGFAIAPRLAGEPESRCARNTRILELRQSSQTFEFIGLRSRPILSLLRGLSAPVRLHRDISDSDLAFLIKHDSDPFARWDALQSYAARVVGRSANAISARHKPASDTSFLSSLLGILCDKTISPRFMAELLTLPDERVLDGMPIDVDGVHHARERVMDDFAHIGRDQLFAIYQRLSGNSPFARDNDSVGRRKMACLALNYLVRIGDEAAIALCRQVLATSLDFTEQISALRALHERGGALGEEALDVFRSRHADDTLALAQSYRIQAARAHVETAQAVDDMLDGMAFDGGLDHLFAATESFFCNNRYGFHALNGAGYAVFAKHIVRIDRAIPLMSSWLFSRSDMPLWRCFDPLRQRMMCATIGSILDADGVSPGLQDICRLTLDQEDVVQPVGA